jgi:hypothetical protein
VPFTVLDKDPEELVELGKAAKEVYAKRDDRMDLDQGAYEMDSRSQDKDKKIVPLNDCKVLAKKSAAMIAANPPSPEVSSKQPEQDLIAQQVEDFLVWWREEADYRYMRGIRNPLIYDEVQTLLIRGWLCGLLTLDPDPAHADFPWRYRLLDPICVYPRLAGDTTLYIAHVYDATVAEIIGEYGAEAEKVLGDREYKEILEVSSIYTDMQYACVVDGQFLQKSQHDYGFNPIHVAMAAGGFYRATEKRSTDWTAHMGTGSLDAVRTVADEFSDLTAMLRTMAEKEAMPPTVIYTDDDGDLIQVDLRTGGKTKLAQKDRVELLHVGPDMRNFQPLLEIMQTRVAMGGLGPTAYQDKPFSSGFHEAIAQGTARDMIYPYVRALERYYQNLYRDVLHLFTMTGNSLNYTSTDQNTGRRTAVLQLDPQQVLAADVVVECKFDDVTPQDEMARVNQAAILAREKLLSLDTIRRTKLGSKNTQLENTRVLGDLIWMNPMISQVGAQVAMARSSDPLVQQIAAMQALQPPGQGGQNPQDPNAQPPLPGVGVPNSVLPSPMGPLAGMEPNTAPVGPPGSGPIPTLDTII